MLTLYNVRLVRVLKKWLMCENSRNGKLHKNVLSSVEPVLTCFLIISGISCCHALTG